MLETYSSMTEDKRLNVVYFYNYTVGLKNPPGATSLVFVSI